MEDTEVIEGHADILEYVDIIKEVVTFEEHEGICGKLYDLRSNVVQRDIWV